MHKRIYVRYTKINYIAILPSINDNSDNLDIYKDGF